MLLFFLVTAASAPTRLPPVDQCTSDAAFNRFKSALASAVHRKDSVALTELMDDNVRLSFGGRAGKPDFRKMWLGQPAEQERLWRELEDVLALGCAVQGQARVFPSMFVQGKHLDGFSTWVARPGARLRSRPSFTGPVRARFSWHVLTTDGPWTGGEWIKIATVDGRRGYVHKSAVRSIIGYRLFAERRDNRWRIAAFIAGD